VRGYAGTFFGRAPKSYLLGGVDNWLFNSTNYSGTKNPLVNSPTSFNENLLFAEFATSLRGFDYATQYGNSVAVLNTEFRIPLVRALSGGPITSISFVICSLPDFMIWVPAGPVPFPLVMPMREEFAKSSAAHSYRYQRIPQPLALQLRIGFRSMIFGYYVKCDLAWPVVNYKYRMQGHKLV